MHWFSYFSSVLGFSIVLTSGLSPSVQAKPVRAAIKAASTLPDNVSQALAQAGVPAEAMSVLIAPLPSAASTQQPATSARLQHRIDASMNPASVMKLITTYAGLSLLGPDFTWRNRVYTDGPVHNGVLQGNLIVRGSGDPKLVLERVQALMAQIQAQGVREVRGDIILDRSVFDIQPRAPGTFDDEALRPYNAAPDGLLVNFKSLIYSFTPDPLSGVARIGVEPPIADVTVTPSVTLTTGACNDWRSSLRGQFASPAQIQFTGNYAHSCGEKKWPVAYAAPEQFASRVIKAMWMAAGGSLSGTVREGATPANARLLTEAPSLPLSDIVADINKFSNNVMAQQLFLSLSSQNDAVGRFETSRQRVLNWWRTTLPDQPEPVLENGSGLSRQERSSAAALTRLLQLAAIGPYAQVFQNSLGLAGVDGTVARLKERNPNAAAIGQAWLKTGSLRDVTSLAGYVQGRSGQRYSFVAIVNHPNAPQARPALDALLEWTVRDTKDPADRPILSQGQRQ
jgi:D-alanyl-D-alanine carboxypeptidase/D-alanyl-D-alanine-endopeptidase (penicillin-binding protein 4)